ncbi:MAG: MFS transporter [Spirochaetales bacterium]|uniref:MFS transporter n=1 Tax=Candidatus Thalassospirochaeta sargassi TaxID=3119039 RepID=A0AAJ1MKT9_9SPIO|nr:MFS transporter [Spirochaetales bacterium]
MLKNKKLNYMDVPFKPSRMPFFYGWIILILGIIGVTMSIPGQTMGVSVFTDDLINVLRISRVQLSLAYLVGTIASALILTPAGKLLDKAGSRNMGSIVTFLLGMQLILMSNLEEVLNFLNGGSGAGQFIISFSVIAVSFFLIRFLGQGMLTLISRNMVMMWFDKYRGLANAILGIFTSFIFSLAPRILNGMIEDVEWDGTWFRLGIIIMTAGAALYWLLSRNNPSKCGMEPDGNLHLAERKVRPAGHPRKDFTLEQARKTLPFWAFGLTLCLSSLFVTAFTFHVVSIFETAGMTRTQAVDMFLPASFIAVIINFSVSMISDYIKLRYILIAQASGLLITMFSVTRLAPGPSLVLFIVGYGVITGLFNISTTVVWPRYYGTEHLGAITGMIMGLIVTGSAIGPYLFSIVFRTTGSYSAAAFICFAIMAVLFVLAFFVRRPVHPDFKAD